MSTYFLQIDSLSSNIIIGIVTGVLTTALLYLISRVFIEWVIPWYRSIKYSGIDISGVWETEQEFELSREYSLLNLVQKAERLDGLWTISITENKSSHNEIKTYKVEGIIEDRFAILTAKNTDRRQIGISTILVEATGNGYELEGSEVWYSVDNKKIKTNSIFFKRKK